MDSISFLKESEKWLADVNGFEVEVSLQREKIRLLETKPAELRLQSQLHLQAGRRRESNIVVDGIRPALEALGQARRERITLGSKAGDLMGRQHALLVSYGEFVSKLAAGDETLPLISEMRDKLLQKVVCLGDLQQTLVA